MRRKHLFELEDQQWFPKSWRNFGTDYLSFMARKFKIYDPVSPMIREMIRSTGKNEWIDVASGGGGGLVNLAQILREDHPELKIILSDYFPNTEAFERTLKTLPGAFTTEQRSVDARQLPQEYAGCLRTMFGAFHHFKEEDARKILQNAIDSQSPIAIFEPVGRNAGSFISMLFAIPNVWLLTPFIRPFRPLLLPFIYLIPLIPLFILWDGIVSILRTYSEPELKRMTESLKNTENFVWQIGKIKNGPSYVYYLNGRPAKE